MGARAKRAGGGVGAGQGDVFCCDADSLINLERAGLLRKMRRLLLDGRVRIPEGVDRELRRKTDDLGRKLRSWDKKHSVVEKLDGRALELLPALEKRFGDPFPVGRKTYGGFWNSASGRKSVDGQVVALAKARGWVAISNDDSIHGACMLEGVVCRRWEEIGRLVLGPEQQQLPL